MWEGWIQAHSFAATHKSPMEPVGFNEMCSHCYSVMFIHTQMLFKYGMLSYPKNTLANILQHFQLIALSGGCFAPVKQVNITLLEVWSLLC